MNTSSDNERTRRDPQADSDQLVSVVVPAFNEAQNIPLLYRRVAEVLTQAVSRNWELIFADDGSRDATWSVICALAADDPKVRGVRLSRNFGHQYALLAGLEAAGGDAVIMMDCDLQHPVEMVPMLLERWRSGFKVVKTMRQDSCEIGWFKRWTSRAFYRLFSVLSGVNLQPGLADFRLLDRRALDELLRLREEGLFLRGLTEWIGFPSCVIPYQAGQRACGQSQYSVKKMVRLAWNGVSSFSITPLRIGILIGLIGSLVSLLSMLYAFFGKIFGRGLVPGWASTLMVISLLFFLLFVYLGVLGEYIGRIIVEVRHRPRFIVCETRGFGKRTRIPDDILRR
ncbi:MAG: glycosyltransferase family 2 protein [Desulfobacterales bacterium]|jgi:dolichol-phosphate mannosyltransferase|nr:glycosyltransferase family 2 protein [Desulfobacterales bacterium]